MLFKPFVSHLFVEDGEDVNVWFGDIIINAKIIDAKTILGSSQTTQSFDPRLAPFPGLVPQVSLDGFDDASTIDRAKAPQIFDGFWRKDDLISHFWLQYGQNCITGQDSRHSRFLPETLGKVNPE